MLAREARELKLDENDTIVRRRLAQKLNSSSGTPRGSEPTEADLQPVYGHARALPDRATRVVHACLFQSRATKGRLRMQRCARQAVGPPAKAPKSATVSARWSSGTKTSSVTAHSDPISRASCSRSSPSVERTIESGYGFHLVRVPACSTAIAPVRRGARAGTGRVALEQENAGKERYLAELRKKYNVVVDESVKPLFAPGHADDGGSATVTRISHEARAGGASVVRLDCDFAHEVRPAYLELREARAGGIHVLWKTPMRGDLRLALDARILRRDRRADPGRRPRAGAAAITAGRLRAPALRGQTRADRRPGGHDDRRSGPDRVRRRHVLDAAADAAAAGGDDPAAAGGCGGGRLPQATASSHILLGVDHLLFVLALLIVARGAWLLLDRTAFTVAHSITLALATLGFVHVPPPPVEAVIALSIAFVAVEIVRAPRGPLGLAARAPWIVAFAFGLLHGFGFAGALSEVGLPAGQIPLALLFFNLSNTTNEGNNEQRQRRHSRVHRRVDDRPAEHARHAPADRVRARLPPPHATPFGRIDWAG